MFNRIRNIRKRWFLVAASVALLAVGLVGGTVFAAGAPSHVIGNVLAQGYDHDDRRGGKDNSSAIMARVAEILGIEQDTLEGAFATALDEQANAKFEERMAALVADETLTQEQSDAANVWFDERPSNSGRLALKLARTSDSDKVDNFLARLVENEKLTQDESDALGAWHDNRPDSLPEASRGEGRHGHGDEDDDGDEDDGDEHNDTRWGKYGRRG